MIKKIRSLQQASSSLEPSAEQKETITKQAVRYGREYLADLPNQKAFTPEDDQEEIKPDLPFSEKPTNFSDLLDYLQLKVDTKGLNNPSPGMMGYIPGGGIYPAALADYLAAITNRYAGVSFTGPGAVQMENQCIRWLCNLIGYSNKSGGNLTSGGSIANLIALVDARDDAKLASKDFHKAVIYTTRQVHHCVIKAIKFAGLGDAHLRTIEMDDQFRMKVPKLKEQIARDSREGLKPLVIFASAGTTDIGAVDPLEAIAQIAQGHNIWFHVDAAYGGAFLLTEHGQKMMQGIDQADSVTIDPHKGLFLPYGTGALLVKDIQKLYHSQHMEANYLQDTYEAEALSPADLSPELSKHFRGLRMWLPLQLYGTAPFRAALDEKLLLCRYFYREIQKIAGIEVGPAPQLSIMYFRYIPEQGDANAFNKALVHKIHHDGRLFLSSTHIGDTIYIRMAILNFRTHLDMVDKAISLITEWIQELNNINQPAS